MTKIAGIERVFEAVGFETRFHDAEVLSLCLDRGYEPALTLSLLTPGHITDPQHAASTRPDCLVRMRFEDIDDLRVEGFNHQNVIQELILREAAQRTEVLLPGVFGVDCSFTCTRAHIVSVEETTLRAGIPRQ